jgi:hypothetical protein
MEQEIKNEDLGQPLGVLFDTINYYKLEDLEKFISELNHDQALYCIVQACQAAFKRNSYNIIESELLSKAIRKISTPNISS